MRNTNIPVDRTIVVDHGARMLNRRSLLRGLLGALAAPAIVRTPGILMPIKPPLPAVVPIPFPEPDRVLSEMIADFDTANVKVSAYEQYSVNWSDWHGAYGGKIVTRPALVAASDAERVR